MDIKELEERLDILANCDPDYVVDVLGVTSEEIVELFHGRAVAHIEEEWGELE